MLRILLSTSLSSTKIKIQSSTFRTSLLARKYFKEVCENVLNNRKFITFKSDDVNGGAISD